MIVVGCAQPPRPGQAANTPPPPPSRRTPPPCPNCPPPPQVLTDSLGGVASGPVVVAPPGLVRSCETLFLGETKGRVPLHNSAPVRGWGGVGGSRPAPPPLKWLGQILFFSFGAIFHGISGLATCTLCMLLVRRDATAGCDYSCGLFAFTDVRKRLGNPIVQHSTAPRGSGVNVFLGWPENCFFGTCAGGLGGDPPLQNPLGPPPPPTTPPSLKWSSGQGNRSPCSYAVWLITTRRR